MLVHLDFRLETSIKFIISKSFEGLSRLESFPDQSPALTMLRLNNQFDSLELISFKIFTILIPKLQTYEFRSMF